MNNIIGFIGTGNMGSALLRGIVKSKVIEAKNIYIYDKDIIKTNNLRDELKVNVSRNIKELIESTNIIILSVKPNIIDFVLEECKESFNENKILVSIAVGIKIKRYKKYVGDNVRIIRVMPNTPALIGEGVSVLSKCNLTSDDDLNIIVDLFKSVGIVQILKEDLMNEITALTGSSPAYVFMFIKAMADEAVKSGIPKEIAIKLAAKAVLGSAKMVLETDIDPNILKEQVCSPGGTTIEAVQVLEKGGFEKLIGKAMAKCTKRAIEISNKK